MIALWNYAEVGATASARRVALQINNLSASAATIQQVDPEHGDALVEYEKVGSPRYPTPAQLLKLRAAAELPPPVVRLLDGGALNLEIPADGLMLVTIAAKSVHAR